MKSGIRPLIAGRWSKNAAGRLVATLCLVAFVPGCGDGSGIPKAAQKLRRELTEYLVRAAPDMSNVVSNLVYVLNPGSSLAPDITLTPDTSLGAPPFAFTIVGTLDGDGDMLAEATINGTAVYASDPTDFDGFTSVSGQLEIDVSMPFIGTLYAATVDYEMTNAQTTLSGTIEVTDPMAFKTTTVTVSSADPLVLKPATGGSNARSNACGFSAQGNAEVSVEAPTGSFLSTIIFLFASRTISLQHSTFTDDGGQTSNVPDAEIELGCGDDIQLDDWEGTYDVKWFCLPFESGEYQTTASVSGSTLVFEEDGEDDLSVDPVGSSPRAVRGFFIGGPDGTQYREDVTRTLLENGNFSEFSVYKYIEGPRLDAGGVCASTGTRVD